MKKFFTLTLISLLTGCGLILALNNYSDGNDLLKTGLYETAIEEYKKGLNNTYDFKLRFSFYNNIGVSYMLLGNYEEAKNYFLKAVKTRPARAYYPYMNLADISRKQGGLLKALEYSQKAKLLVESATYGRIEKEHTAYGLDTVKKRVLAQNDYFQLLVDSAELRKQFDRKNYRKVKRLADKVLNRKYRISIGIDIVAGRTVSLITDGGIGDLNGIIKSDEIFEIDGIAITDNISWTNATAKLSERFGEKVNIKIKRNNREITIACYLYYPELETTKQMLNKAENLIARGKAKKSVKDRVPPRLLVMNPQISGKPRTVANKNIELVILAGDNYKVKRVLVNGKKTTASDANNLEKALLPGQVKKYTKTVTLKKGKNTLRIKAFDSSGNRTSKELRIVYNPNAVEQQDTIYRHNIAVVIGIDKYTAWPSLEFAKSDAKAIKEKLYALGYHKVIELYDSEATRLQILRLLSDTLPNILGENDSIMIYFAGHGYTETYEYKDTLGQTIKEKEGYIIPVDSNQKNFKGTAISMSKIRDLSAKYKAKHILYVFDSCYSGLGLKRSGGIKQANDYIKKLSQMKAVQIITAGGENEQVGEEKGHGIFTRHFLSALNGKADIDSDGFITASEIGAYIRPTVSRLTKNTQTPRFGWILGEGDFIFENALN